MGRNVRAVKAAKALAKLPKVLNSSVEMVAPRSKTTRTKPTGLSFKKKVHAITRRSDRLRNVTPPARNQQTGPLVEEINLCESEKEDEPHVEENPPALVPAEESLEEKMDYFVQPVKGLKSKAAKRHVRSDSPSADLRYKRLYFDSQKKIEALTHENDDLSRKLEVALGKIEAYGESSRVCSDLLGQLKDVLLILNIPSQVVQCRCSSPGDGSEPKASMKRKRMVK